MRRCFRIARAPGIALALTFVLLSLLPSAHARDALRDGIERDLHAQGLAGAVWATVDEAGRVRVDAAGVADARNAQPMRPDHRVQVGSIAKAVLATGVLRLATEGRLVLDAPVRELLPGLRLDNPWEATDPVRIRHLLDHTAGLDDMRLWQFFSLRADPDTPLAHGHPRTLRVRSRPGTRFSYSNTGYALLGRVIERATGARYDRYLDAHLLAPLGMADSTFGFVTQHQRGARLAMGHFEDGMAQPAVPLFVRPAAQFTTTAADMARFAAFLMGDGRIGGRAFIDPALMRMRGHATDTEAARAGLRVGYALGLGVRDRHGAAGLCHGGDTVGFRTMLCVFPGPRRAFFIAFNADVEGADYAGIRARLVDALGVAAAASPTAPMAVDPAEWAGVYVPAPNRFDGFRYLDTVFGAWRVRVDGAGLRIDTLQAPPLRLRPAGGALLRQPDRVLPSHALIVADGERLIAREQGTHARVSSVAIALLWANLLVGVAGLLYVLIIGALRVLQRRPWRVDALRLPWLALVLLAVPTALFARQPFLQLGDASPASVSLAATTALLPLAALSGLAVIAREWRTRAAVVDAVALLAAVQWLAVLAAWGLLPLRLWAV